LDPVLQSDYDAMFFQVIQRHGQIFGEWVEELGVHILVGVGASLEIFA
jgi:hypothetical protein